MDTPYVREFHEDRDITAWFLLDISPSVEFRDVPANARNGPSSSNFAANDAVSYRRGNRVGTMVFAGRETRTIRPAADGSTSCG